MRSVLICVMVLAAGCAYNPEKGEKVGREESARLDPAARPLSTFRHYEVKPMTLADAVREEEDKVVEADKLKEKHQAMLSKLLEEWNSADKEGRSGTLVIEPHLVHLRIVSGGARFFAGAFAGGSEVEMDLNLVDKDTGESVGKPRISREAGAIAGAWSIGKSDDNLLDYIVEISHQYLLMNY